MARLMAELGGREGATLNVSYSIVLSSSPSEKPRISFPNPGNPGIQAPEILPSSSALPSAGKTHPECSSVVHL